MRDHVLALRRAVRAACRVVAAARIAMTIAANLRMWLVACTNAIALDAALVFALAFAAFTFVLEDITLAFALALMPAITRVRVLRFRAFPMGRPGKTKQSPNNRQTTRAQ